MTLGCLEANTCSSLRHSVVLICSVVYHAGTRLSGTGTAYHCDASERSPKSRMTYGLQHSRQAMRSKLR